MKKKGGIPAIDPYGIAFGLGFLVIFGLQLNNIMNTEFYIKVTGVRNLEPDYPYVRAIALTQLKKIDYISDEPEITYLTKKVHYCSGDKEEPLTLKDLAMFYSAYVNGKTEGNTYNNDVEEITINVESEDQLKEYMKNILSSTFPDPCKDEKNEECIRQKNRFCIEILPLTEYNTVLNDKIFVYPMDDITKCGPESAYYFLPNAIIEVRYAWPE